MIEYIQNETYSEKIIIFPQSDVLINSVRYELQKKPTLKDKYLKGDCYSESVFKSVLEKISDNEFKLNSFQLDFCCGDYIEEYWIEFVNGTQISLLQRELNLNPSFSYLDKIEPLGEVPYNKMQPKVLSKKIDGNVITITEDSDLIQVVFQTVGLNGSSAYEIALNNGFIGTEGEWLESLKLHYSDLTEAEILELQQPAIEAAQTANQAADNANTATQNAITATNEANTATVSANQAAQTANASATSADNSADLATLAATNANDAATAANTAANFANSQRGWSPKFVFEEDGAQRLVKKLDSWIGGTGTAPTDNVGMYVADSGYVADKSLAENFKGAQGDNLIFEYVHSGNKEVYVESIDYTTNTFTSVGHGFTNNQRVCFNVDVYDVLFPSAVVPISGLSNVLPVFYIVNTTSDTFQISLTSSGAAVTLTNKPTIDLTKFTVSTYIDQLLFSNFPPDIKCCEVQITGRSMYGNGNGIYVSPLGINIWGWFNRSNKGLKRYVGGTCMINTVEILNVTGGFIYSNVRGKVVNNISDTSNSEFLINTAYYQPTSENFINNIKIDGISMHNGFSVKIYKR